MNDTGKKVKNFDLVIQGGSADLFPVKKLVETDSEELIFKVERINDEESGESGLKITYSSLFIENINKVTSINFNRKVVLPLSQEKKLSEPKKVLQQNNTTVETNQPLQPQTELKSELDSFKLYLTQKIIKIIEEGSYKFPFSISPEKVLENYVFVHKEKTYIVSFRTIVNINFCTVDLVQ